MLSTRRRTASPHWSRWSEAAAARPWSVGVEEELMLLDPRVWAVVNRIDAVRAALPPPLASQTSAETHACVIELKTAGRPTAALLAAELTRLRGSLVRVLDERLNLRLAAAGTHPTARGSDVATASDARYLEVEATMRALAHREPTMALHVHVAMPDGETAVRALDGMRTDLPLLLALSANSPFWRGTDSGFASIRSPIFTMFPRVGIPRRFGTYGEYVRLVEAMLCSGAIPDPGHLWWDARLQPRLGTLEVRLMDAQSRVGDVAALVALVQCLARRHAEGGPSRAPDAEVLAENRFLASRDGMSAWFIDGSRMSRRPAGDAFAEMVELCGPAARDLGCTEELAGAMALAEEPGYVRQRLIAAGGGIPAVVAELSARFAEVVPVGAAA